MFEIIKERIVGALDYAFSSLGRGEEQTIEGVTSEPVESPREKLKAYRAARALRITYNSEFSDVGFLKLQGSDPREFYKIEHRSTPQHRRLERGRKGSRYQPKHD
jgi:hypothetical protein